MQTRPQTISALSFYGRALRKLSRPGVLPALIAVQRLDDSKPGSAGDVLVDRARKTPSGTAIKFEDRAYSWAEVNTIANQYASVLADAGVQHGDVVAVNVTNRPEMLFSIMGVIKLGATAALINTGLVNEALAHCYGVAKASAVIVGEEQVEAVSTLDPDALPPARFFLPDRGAPPTPDGYVDLAAAAQNADASEPKVSTPIKLGDPAAYIYTSGTTGYPKAAVIVHRKLVMGGLFLGKALRELNPDDVLYCPTPLYHVSGLVGGWFACMGTGSAFVPARSFSASRFWDEIRRYDVSAFNYVGELARYLWNQPPTPRDRDHRVRTIVGPGLRHDIWDGFKERFGIPQVHEMYGGSETPTGFVNLFNFDRTCGWNPRGWRVAEWDSEKDEVARGADGFARRVKPGGSGIMLFEISDKQSFDGYTDKGASEKKLLRNVFREGDAWYDSGDLMFNQGHGHVSFVDRLGDTFRWRSENVATTEVEAALVAHPDVAEAIVYGVQIPEHEGRAGAARIFLRDCVEEADLGSIAAHLRAELPDYAVPRVLRVAKGTAEVTGTFKHRKGDLKNDGYGEHIEDALYLLVPGEAAPRALDDEVRRDLKDAKIRL